MTMECPSVRGCTWEPKAKWHSVLDSRLAMNRGYEEKIRVEIEGNSWLEDAWYMVKTT